MRKFNAFRSKLHNESSHRPKTTTTTTITALKTNNKSNTIIDTNHTTPTQPITISAPIINRCDKVVIDDKDQSDENLNEEQTSTIEDNNIEEQITLSEEPEKMSDKYNHTDDQVD